MMKTTAFFVWLAVSIYITINGSIGVSDFDWIVWLSMAGALVLNVAVWAIRDAR